LNTKSPQQRPLHILHCALNQDGRSATLTAPNGPSQLALLRGALREGRVSAPDVSECHGTGTALGDPIEVGGLGCVMSTSQRPLALRSTKSNMGHLEGAAGIAGFITCIILLMSPSVAPTLHLRNLNPHLDMSSSSLLFASEGVHLPETPDAVGV
jgi:acyl transferase domain-containing protein